MSQVSHNMNELWRKTHNLNIIVWFMALIFLSPQTLLFFFFQRFDFFLSIQWKSLQSIVIFGPHWLTLCGQKWLNQWWVSKQCQILICLGELSLYVITAILLKMLSKGSAFIIVHNEIQDLLFIIINKLINKCDV